MSDWGRATFGDPCRECGYSWPLMLADIVTMVQQTPTQMRQALGETSGTAKHPDLVWDARSYVCHVVDNLRIWTERLVAATLLPEVHLSVYDAEALALARAYDAVPLQAAFWSLEQAVDAWVGVVRLACKHDAVLWHPERGRLKPIDIASSNAHDAQHHVHDIRRCVG